MSSSAQYYTLTALAAIPELSQELAQAFPLPAQYRTGIYELLINAMEHGTLGIGFAAKTDLIRSGKWREEVDRRLALPENIGKKVTTRLAVSPGECRLTITDPGQGFPWRDYLAQPGFGKRPNGRGLLIAFHSGFDEIFFNTTGNAVTCVARRA